MLTSTSCCGRICSRGMDTEVMRLCTQELMFIILIENSTLKANFVPGLDKDWKNHSNTDLL